MRPEGGRRGREPVRKWLECQRLRKGPGAEIPARFQALRRPQTLTATPAKTSTKARASVARSFSLSTT
jgi:hypothetical protein